MRFERSVSIQPLVTVPELFDWVLTLKSNGGLRANMTTK
jgi:hypothetical protein